MINKVTNGDFRVDFKNIPDKYFGLIIADPPYGNNWLGLLKKRNSTEKESMYLRKAGYKIHNYKEWDLKPPSQEDVNLILSKTKYAIIWGANYFSNLLPPAKCWIIWDKCEDKFTGVQHEMAWSNFDKGIKIYHIPHWEEKGICNTDDTSNHPTRKFAKLYKLILRDFAKPGWKIGDPYIGGGSIRRACYDMNFHLEGWEIDKEYYDDQEKSFNDYLISQECQGSIYSKEDIQGAIYKEKDLL